MEPGRQPPPAVYEGIYALHVAAGVVAELWRYPVKSMAGEPVPSMRVDWRGAAGDRAHAVSYEHKGVRRPLTAREAPGMLGFRAAYPFAEGASLEPGRPPSPQVTGPDGRSVSWADGRLRRRLSEALGRDVALERDGDGLQDVRRTLHVTVEATRRALEEELGQAIDLRRFRPNLHLELDAPAWAELDWVGRTLRLEGGVALHVKEPCERCAIPTRDPDTQDKWPELLRELTARHDMRFGVLAQVVVAGRVAVGQRVELA